MAKKSSSVLKQQRKSERRRLINKANKSRLRTAIKKLREAIAEKNVELALKQSRETFSLIDRAVKKGTIHENTGSRYKSRLQKSLNLLLSQ
ncbi:MAG: 30S ribosomal protein S20 [Candidatus Aminicenantia bacterium]